MIIRGGISAVVCVVLDSQAEIQGSNPVFGISFFKELFTAHGPIMDCTVCNENAIQRLVVL